MAFPSVGLTILVLAPVLGGFHVIVDWMGGNITTSLRSVYPQGRLEDYRRLFSDRSWLFVDRVAAAMMGSRRPESCG